MTGSEELIVDAAEFGASDVAGAAHLVAKLIGDYAPPERHDVYSHYMMFVTRGLDRVEGAHWLQADVGMTDRGPAAVLRSPGGRSPHGDE